MNKYLYKGAQACINLHAIEIKKFHLTWQKAKKKGILLPDTDDSDYVSMETLFRHVLRSSRGYMIWMCSKLDLPDPEIDSAPEPENIEKDAESYIMHLLERWSLPLAAVMEKRFGDTVYPSNWGTPYSIEAMLEHAVMHPIRHRYQLELLMSNSK